MTHDVILAEAGYINAWQRLITSGRVWRLPLRFGRMASALIAAGTCCNTMERD